MLHHGSMSPIRLTCLRRHSVRSGTGRTRPGTDVARRCPDAMLSCRSCCHCLVHRILSFVISVSVRNGTACPVHTTWRVRTARGAIPYLAILADRCTNRRGILAGVVRLGLHRFKLSVRLITRFSHSRSGRNSVGMQAVRSLASSTQRAKCQARTR